MRRTATACWIAVLTVACGGSGPASSAPTDPDRPPGLPALGIGSSLLGRRPFPDDNPWNTLVADQPVDPNSANLLRSIGLDRPLHPDFGPLWEGQPVGMPYLVVGGQQARLPVRFEYADESDPGPYPVPLDAPIEGGPQAAGDRHVLVIDRDHWKLYELFDAHPEGNGWRAGSGAVFDLASNALRPLYWTSADAAGLPVFPGLVRYDEAAEAGEIRHALRFTCRRTRRAFVAPARHWASSLTDPNLPPMGLRVRLKASYVIPTSWPREAQAVARCLQRYGMILADNGSDWYVSGTHDRRWDFDRLRWLKQIRGSDLEVVRMGPLTTP
ncbi:MAG: hypothetical protein IT204_12350 [Fimbriimonadaceae bacterium]|nr:hypothetical protein [Fimbriimonadaceae bacterium]